MNPLYILLGFLFLAIGALGLVLPLLPTTPLVLLAAACFARSSPRWHAWLLRSRTFGPMIHRWETHRCISRRVKALAVTMMVVVGGYSIAFELEALPGRVLGTILLGVGMIAVLRLRSCEACTDRAA